MIFELPNIQENKDIYIFGSGLMGLSYKRQIEINGFKDRLRGFIEYNKTTPECFGYPVYELESFCKTKTDKSQVLIASKKFKAQIYEQLFSSGWDADSIISPLSYRWKGKINISSDFFNIQRTICLYETIDSIDKLNIVYKRTKKLLCMLGKDAVMPRLIIACANNFDFDEQKFSELEFIKQTLHTTFTRTVLDDADLIFILKPDSYTSIDAENRHKIHFYGISLISGFERRCKYYLSKKMPTKHSSLVKKIKKKKKIKVVFLSVYKGIWKLDTLFTKLMNDQKFEPLILVCPYTEFGEERMWLELEESLEYFTVKGYPVLSSYCKKRKKWLSLTEVNPDIVFINRAHGVTFYEYHENAYLNFLSCYIPYYFDIATSGDNSHYYNRYVHVAVWKNFVSTYHSLKESKKHSTNLGSNCELTGHPMLEPFVSPRNSSGNAWNYSNEKKKKIIFAPHQSIENHGNLQMSSFLVVADKVRSIAEKYRNFVQWSFKPHPMLISKLYAHPEWGYKRTNEYYDFWKQSPYTQINNDDYVELFLESDAIIHDCGSFIFEYLFTNKPCAYLLLKPETQIRSLNEFGIESLNLYRKIYHLEQLEAFVSEIANGNLTIQDNSKFIKKNITTLYIDSSPSTKIIKSIKKSIWEN